MKIKFNSDDDLPLNKILKLNNNYVNNKYVNNNCQICF